MKRRRIWTNSRESLYLSELMIKFSGDSGDHLNHLWFYFTDKLCKLTLRIIYRGHTENQYHIILIYSEKYFSNRKKARFFVPVIPRSARNCGSLFSNSKPTHLYVFVRAIGSCMGRHNGDYRRDLSVRIIRKFTRKTHRGPRERADEILAPNHSRSSQCREICRAQSRSDTIRRGNCIMAHCK